MIGKEKRLERALKRAAKLRVFEKMKEAGKELGLD